MDCCKTDKFFCELCSEQTINFICCETVQCIKNYSKCPWIDDKSNGHCLGWNETMMGYKCAFCSDVFNHDGNECECNEWHCDYHQDLMKSYCKDCGGEYCMNRHHGITCDGCHVFQCDACFDKSLKLSADDWKWCEMGQHTVLCGDCWDQNGVTCKGCKYDYCGNC